MPGRFNPSSAEATFIQSIRMQEALCNVDLNSMWYIDKNYLSPKIHKSMILSHMCLALHK